MKNKEPQYYLCECGSEGIIGIEYEEDTLDLAFFRMGLQENPLALSFKDKLRWIWKIITTGHPYCDMVILDKQTAKRLGTDLIKFTRRTV